MADSWLLSIYPVLRALVPVLILAGPLAAAEPDGAPGHRSLAGQICPQGTYVIGFDDEANILCSEACGNRVLNTGETCDDGNRTSGDGCSATCTSEGAVPATGAAAVAAEVLPASPQAARPPASPAIDTVRPWSVAYGTREVTITVRGTGFSTDSVIVFEGGTYPSSVNQEGTQLVATIPTRGLGMGSYAITVSNGPGMQNTLKKALEVY